MQPELEDQKFPQAYLAEQITEGQLVRLHGLESMMRPRRLADMGFLGEEESLIEVMKEDDDTLHVLGVSYEKIADRLKYFIEVKAPRLPDDRKSRYEANWFERRFGRNISGRRINIYDPFDPQWQIEGHFVTSETNWMGSVGCPWGDDTLGEWKEGALTRPYNPQIQYKSMDKYILNTRLGRVIAYPGLAVHLIRDHHFFEGKRCPYRVDPIEAVYVLEIPSNLSEEQLEAMSKEKPDNPGFRIPWNLNDDRDVERLHILKTKKVASMSPYENNET